MAIVPDGPISTTPIKPDGPITPDAPVSQTPIQPDGAISSSPIKPDGPVSSTPIKPDGPITQAPTPTATPHKYDTVIRDAAKPYGVDVNVLRAIGMQESGLGTGGNFNSTTGLDRDGNAGHGIFQLDPASGAPKAVLDRAAKDPAFAAQYAAKMMSQNLKKTNGDLRGALAMYNSGSATSPQGLAYADQVLGRMKSDDAPDYSPEIVQKVQHDYKIIKNTVRAGKPLSEGLARTPEGKPLHRLEVNAANAMDWFNHHKVEGALDIMGAPQRALGGFEEESGKGEDAKTMLHHISDYVFNPTPKNQALTTRGPADTINRFAERHGAKGNAVPTHEQIDAFVKANTRIPQVLKPYAQAVLKAGEDFGLQEISDPTQSSEVSRAIRYMGGHGAKGVLGAVGTVANTMGLGKYFGHLSPMHSILDKATEYFGVRNDLDRAGFTSEGKKVRLATENAEISKYAQRKKEAEEASKTADAAEAHLMQLAHQHGSPRVSALAAAHPSRAGQTVARPTRSVSLSSLGARPVDAIRNMTPDERKEAFDELHIQIRDNEIKRRTNELVKQHPDLIKGNPTNHKAIVDSLNTQDLSKLHTFMNQGVDYARPLTELGKKSVVWNPIPHGLVNVGTLAYMAGGMNTVMKGFGHMINPAGVKPQTLDRLRDMGALDDYAHIEHNATSPLAKFGQAYGKGAEAMLQRMEQGWRAGLLDEMDRKLGPSLPGSKEEMLKGRMISERIGDYRNRSAFTKMFQMMGGPFVMFRLGIVPQNFMRTLQENPERIAAQLRGMYDLDNDRTHKNQQLSFGGPTGDVLKFLSNPAKFLASPSTAGPILEAYSIMNNYHGLLDSALQLGSAYIPALETLTDAGKDAAGTSSHQSIPDDIADFLMKNFLEIDKLATQKGSTIKAARKKNERQIGL